MAILFSILSNAAFSAVPSPKVIEKYGLRSALKEKALPYSISTFNILSVFPYQLIPLDTLNVTLRSGLSNTGISTFSTLSAGGNT